MKEFASRSLSIAAVLLALVFAPESLAVTCSGAGRGVTLASSPLAFGNYTVLAQSTANQVVTLTCASTVVNEGAVSWRLQLTVGSTSGAGGLANRTMFNGTNALLYNIYTAGGFTTIWGNTSATSVTGSFNFVGPSGTTLSAVVTGFGRITANQDLATGNYSTTTTLQAQARVPNASGGTTYNSPAFNVTAVIPANCLIDSAGDIPFGAYDPTSGSNVDVRSNLVARCTRTTPYTIALSQGGGASFSPRKMASAGANTDQLNYNLFTSAAYATVWGDGTSGTSTQGGTGAGILAAEAVTRSIYGRLFASQDVSTDTYSDTITVTVTY
jgi:spore coat protein U-like protein